MLRNGQTILSASSKIPFTMNIHTHTCRHSNRLLSVCTLYTNNNFNNMRSILWLFDGENGDMNLVSAQGPILIIRHLICFKALVVVIFDRNSEFPVKKINDGMNR